MHKKQFYSRRTINRRQQLLQKLAKQQNYPDSSSKNNNDNDNVNRHAHTINPVPSNILSELGKDLSNYDDHYADEHDNANKLNDFQDEA